MCVCGGGGGVTKRAIIDVYSIISGRNYDIFTSIIAQLLPSLFILLVARYKVGSCKPVFSSRQLDLHLVGADIMIYNNM